MKALFGTFHILRLLRAAFILGREGVFLDVDPGLLPPAAQPGFFLFRRLARKDARTSEDRLPRAMARLGPSYVKLGQFLATRPDIVGIQTARTLERLQDRMAPSRGRRRSRSSRDRSASLCQISSKTSGSPSRRPP